MKLARSREGPLVLFAALLALSGQAKALEICAATIGEFRAMLGSETFPLTWEETSMGDGKPLVVSILERNGALLIEFVKTREGLWAESAGVVCRAGAQLEIRFNANQIRMGPAAGWALRMALGNGGRFSLSKLGSEQLRIETVGWAGTFSARKRD
jgi:hypothetical protein